MKRNLLLCLFIVSATAIFAQGKQEISLRQWQFSRDGQSWQTVTIPHDWAISGPFDKKWDLQTVAIAQNGEEEATEKSGRSGALPWIGEGFYKTTVAIDSVPDFAELRFDGAMSDAHIVVNGTEAGFWPYGYNAFRINITPFLRKGDNEISVSLNNREESSRWYPGAGLYRPVTLVLSAAERINAQATFVYTKSVEYDQAQLSVSTAVINASPTAVLNVSLIDGEGKTVYCAELKSNLAVVDLEPVILWPRLWSPETPNLYTLHLTLSDNGETLDEQTLKTGIRTISFSKENGFELNGVTRKFKGVCLHHDLGPLGAAVNRAALVRQVKILKDMGCDAIRTSHNMPSAMQMEVYDSLGMMVMAESFDMWRYPKCKNGYARYFDDWWRKDVTNLVLNHRNHPSCILWSIGNEIPEQWSAEGVELAKQLQGLCHSLDPTRPVTQGMDQVANALASGFAQVMDVPGLNYRDHEYLNAYNTLAHGFILGSETASTLSSRGVYKFPVERKTGAVYDDGQCSGYDVEHCWWSNVPEVDFALQEDYPWTVGQFVWTGFDYLGEPTPYDEYWPSRSSYFGICDLAGLPKDRYWLYRSVWNKDAHTVHLLPHWDWPGREGETTPVYCYTDGVEGELFVNGVSQGRIKKDLTRHIQDIDPDSVNVLPLLDRYRLRWNNVKYVPGEIRVVAYDAAGNIIGEDVRRTPSEAVAIRFDCDRDSLFADGDDLCYITVSLVDKDGNELPCADDELAFSVEGQGSFRAVCNGDATSLEVFTEPKMRLFSGKLVVTLQASQEKGTIRLVAGDDARGLSGTFEIKVI